MIKACIFNGPFNQIIGFEISGHADYAPHGEDIICAAVSILGYTALNSLTEVAGVSLHQLQIDIDDKKGYMKVLVDKKVIEEPTNRDVQVVLNTLAIGLETIKESYPKYITIEYRGGGTRV